RKEFKKSIDDIFCIFENEIPDLYPMKIYRCLKRYNLNILPNEFRDAERKIKKFKKYAIGYIHIDLIYAPKLDKQREYVYTAIDRVSKIAFVMFGKKKDKETGAKFFKKVLEFYPYKINYILTDNGFEFSYNALTKNKKTKKIHSFDKICFESKIEHRTIKFKHPWTNGMVENFNKRIKNNVFKKYFFQSIFEMKEKTIKFINEYNFEKRLKSLNYKTPEQFLKEKKGTNNFLQRIVI
ncbi:MAG: integrase core domain-containing protein, partial [Patescibacteria group bacterium]